MEISLGNAPSAVPMTLCCKEERGNGSTVTCTAARQFKDPATGAVLMEVEVPVTVDLARYPDLAVAYDAFRALLLRAAAHQAGLVADPGQAYVAPVVPAPIAPVETVSAVVATSVSK